MVSKGEVLLVRILNLTLTSPSKKPTIREPSYNIWTHTYILVCFLISRIRREIGNSLRSGCEVHSVYLLFIVFNSCYGFCLTEAFFPVPLVYSAIWKCEAIKPFEYLLVLTLIITLSAFTHTLI